MASKNNNLRLRQDNAGLVDNGRPLPAFSAVLTPYRSLSKTGFGLLMAFVSFICIVSGYFFLVAGAWPVMITMGLEAIAIWLAFKLNYRSARRYEEISLWTDKIIFRKVSPSGKSLEFFFNPFWVKFLVDWHEEFGVMAMKLRQAGEEI